MIDNILTRILSCLHGCSHEAKLLFKPWLRTWWLIHPEKVQLFKVQKTAYKECPSKNTHSDTKSVVDFILSFNKHKINRKETILGCQNHVFICCNTITSYSNWHIPFVKCTANNTVQCTLSAKYFQTWKIWDKLCFYLNMCTLLNYSYHTLIIPGTKRINSNRAHAKRPKIDKYTISYFIILSNQ